MNAMLEVLITILGIIVAALGYFWIFGARKSALYKDYQDASRRSAHTPRGGHWDAPPPRGRDLR